MTKCDHRFERYKSSLEFDCICNKCGTEIDDELVQCRRCGMVGFKHDCYRWSNEKRNKFMGRTIKLSKMLRDLLIDAYDGEDYD